jgi:hypothetical protein
VGCFHLAQSPAGCDLWRCFGSKKGNFFSSRGKIWPSYYGLYFMELIRNWNEFALCKEERLLYSIVLQTAKLIKEILKN